jgi:hypothetical protein
VLQIVEGCHRYGYEVELLALGICNGWKIVGVVCHTRKAAQQPAMVSGSAGGSSWEGAAVSAVLEAWGQLRGGLIGGGDASRVIGSSATKYYFELRHVEALFARWPILEWDVVDSYALEKTRSVPGYEVAMDVQEFDNRMLRYFGLVAAHASCIDSAMESEGIVNPFA